MKIKAVCEATGLTDRTIRYYIEEELISPFYTENYLGRKTFDFSESDIRTLNDIAVLRKFGFSIADIQQMLLHPEAIIPIAKQLQDRKQVMIREEQQLLQVLLRLDADHSYTVRELAQYLSTPVEDAPLPAEDTRLNIGRWISDFVEAALICLATWLPAAISGLIIIDDLRTYHYPKIDVRFLALTLFALLPTWLTLLLPRIGRKIKWKDTAKKYLLLLCVLSIPVSSILTFGIVEYSETTDFRHYLDLDSDCLANRSNLFHELFPTWPHYFVNEQQPDGSWKAVYLDAHYYYRLFLGFDYTYDIYAEWPLEQEEFDKEVARIKALFEEHAPEEERRSEYHNYVTIQKGSYECLIIYNGNKPFEEVTNSYSYFIFAYDKESLRVRYIYCDSLENGADQPYYLSLDWQ